ncbi:uncharacterized protein BDZ99DRAFT_458333 [Mytilinidion resinicola]|uniref:Uncharacterized protein n=1 Tax=Mytilinidion resinicola TaxID=574789 RepID=A0A6A6Z5T4_9PEZI|nr:uncharacterized protein BDZ99DRAFT_458333 [Mytilinidion resinicola]KAF2816466.1 hypothetical protein BDZ99DRAFT_458333 [Mytilinidion resinicola]
MPYFDASPTYSNPILSSTIPRSLETSMNHAGRNSAHDFQDLRSAHRAVTHTRARAEKYYSFKGLSPSDLSSPHYVAVCCVRGCKTEGKLDSCWPTSFPADLSTAPVRQFSKREAYKEAQRWPRPPTYHHTYQKDKGKRDRMGETSRWEKRRWKRKWNARVARGEILEDNMSIMYLEEEKGMLLLRRSLQLALEKYWLEPRNDYGGEEEDEDEVTVQVKSMEARIPNGAPEAEEEDEDWDLASVSTALSWIEL